MGTSPIFSATLGLSPPWRVAGVTFRNNTCIEISIDFTCGTFSCPVCGNDAVVRGTENETWHNGNFFMFSAYLMARIPIVECSTCGSNAVERPWAKGTEFTNVP